MFKREGKIALFYFIPIVIAFLFELIFDKQTINSLFNVAENLLFAFVILLFGHLFNRVNYKKIFFKSTLIIFNFCLIFETIYYHFFSSFLNPSAIFVLLETNNTEAKEFFNSHINIEAIIFSFVLTLITIYSFKVVNTQTIVGVFKGNRKLKIMFLLLFTLLFLKFTKLITYNIPYLTIKTPLVYVKEMNKFKVYGKENPTGNFSDVKHIKKDNEKEVYVIAIGESTNKLHFQLYNNYYRQTTPLLNELKDDLLIFNDVISPHTYTIEALSKAFTLGNYENPEGKYQGSILQLFNQAKFKTYWVSNQRPIGLMDTHITKIGQGATKSLFLNTKHTSENTILDIELLNSLNEILLEEGDKKIIFLHMLGTHMDYKNRYPESYNYFKDTPKTIFKKEKVFATINEYDNAVRYNDYLIASIIQMLKQLDVNSYMLYFSDHGQEVFDDIDFFGHTIDENITKNMLEIPMFLWMSRTYKINNKMNFDFNRKYMTDDLIHSIADLSNITSRETDSTRSIFSKSFKERKRIIKDTIDYDIFFKIED